MIDHNEIHRYLLKEMSPEEAQRFRLRMEQDAELRASVDLERDVIAVARYIGRQHGDTVFPTQRRRRKRVVTFVGVGFLAVAASIALLLLFTGSNGLHRLREIDRPHGAAEDQAKLIQGYDLILEDEYEQAKANLAQIRPESDQYPSAQNLLGHTLYLQDSFLLSSERFSQARSLEAPGTEIYGDSWYNFILCLYRLGRNEQAHSELNLLKEIEFGKMSRSMQERVLKLEGKLE